jgi:hypothetical protein
MFPEATFILSLLVLLGMILYRVDELRLNDDQDEIKNQLPEVKIVGSVKRVVDSVIYFVGIRIWRLIRKIKKKFQKK